jgi:hypothetical protein
VPIETSQWQSTVKIDGQVNASNRFGVYYNFRDREVLPWNPSFQVAADPRAWGAIGWKNHLLGVNWTMTPGGKVGVRLLVSSLGSDHEIGIHRLFRMSGIGSDRRLHPVWA